MKILSRSIAILNDISACRVCASQLPNPPKPVLSVSSTARLLIIGQAPGQRVQQSGIPWSDASGRQLRAWLQLSEDLFYDARRIAIVPMGFCYPGKGASGDLPPRAECAPLWHAQLMDAMPDIQLTLLIGRYAQAYYLGPRAKPTLTDTVANCAEYLPTYFPLPHPSPRNRFWLTRNPWFDNEVLPVLRKKVRETLGS